METLPNVFSALSGSGLKARFIRSSGLRVINFGTTQFLRLVSNLILTRILFPEAFGMMALVTVFLTGLSMFSDVGTTAIVQQSKRGDDPVFLNTAWTLQILRGGVLWIATWPLGWAMSGFYDAPLLAWLLPAAGLTLMIDGLKPMRVYTAQRHLQLGRVTVAELVANFINIGATVLLAWWMQSVWALIWGMVLGQSLRLVLFNVLIKGRPDQLLLDRDAVRELIRFGKWIFVSTICGFLNKQGDRLILGKYLSLEALGIYQIGYFLASFPVLLGQAVYSQVMLPYLREKPPAESRENFLAFRRIRILGTGSLIMLTILMALFGPYLVHTYGKVSLSSGNSRIYAGVMVTRAVLSIGFLFMGAAYGGVIGALVGLGLARIFYYPIIAMLAHRYGTWDPKLDAGLACLAIVGGGCAGYFHYPALLELLSF